ncbi:MAG TPA: TetR family transcriptional regulator [Rhizomicrobium sp.]|jgi:TPR repeat protein/AcrR family transcriptional regulator|nr:TetR family transcriptional regulator [Rhizomicrobium sp.]
MPLTAETDAQDSRLARRHAARATIIEAGRKIAMRDGVAELSLSAVAAEAGLNPSTVFGYFRNKDELLLATVAEDLAAVAALMRREPTVVLHAGSDVAPVLVPPSERLSPVLDGDGVRLGSPSSDEVPSEQATQATDSAAESHSLPRVDAWLERRLRVFEHALAEIEQRLKETEGCSARAVSLSEHGTATLFQRIEAFERQQAETVQSLTLRVEEAERRQRGVTSEMRAAMNDAATRIEILESSRRAGQERANANHSAEQTERPSPVRDLGLTQPETSDPSPQEDGYLAAAHRAADAAAKLANLDGGGAVDESAWQTFATTRVRLGRKHYLFAACMAFVAFAVGGFVAFYVGQARGHEMVQVSAVAANEHRSARVKRLAVAHSATADPRARLAILAKAGSAHAELLLGLSYLRGDGGTSADQPKAAEWIGRAAQQHEPVAQYWLGTLYEHGDGVSADSSKAVPWYEAAADQGNRKAMHALGVLYAQGLGIQKNYPMAAKWFGKAASLGLVNSEFNLGVLYERGLGVPQSLREAYKWYAVAAAQGDEESRARIEALKTQLAAQDIAAAQRAADTFRPQPVAEGANNMPELAALSGSTVAHQ